MRDIHSCVEAHIEDVSDTTVSIQEPCCCNHVSIHGIEQFADISLVNNESATYSISNATSDAYIYMIAEGGADITMDWVCGTNYSVNYLKVTPTEVVWISIDYDVDYNVYSNTDWIVS